MSESSHDESGVKHRWQSDHVRYGVLTIMLLGLLLAVALLVHFGFRDILAALARIGWGMAAVVGAHIAQVVLSAVGWHAIATAERRASLWLFIMARWIREAVGTLLPTTQIGGEVVSLRIVALYGYRNGVAAGTMVVDLGAQILSQAVFTLLGLGLLLSDGHYGPIVQWTLLALVASLAALPTFVVIKKRGFLQRTERLFIRLADQWPVLRGMSLEGLHDSIHRLFGQPVLLWRSFNAHLLSWLLGGLEIWLLLYFMDIPVSPREALVIESLSQVVRSAAFAVPGALGVQEGGFMLIGAIYGLPPQMGLALALAKRVREILLGAPGLLAWQLIEGHRFWRRRSAGSA
jgi:putative membrane protein